MVLMLIPYNNKIYANWDEPLSCLLQQLDLNIIWDILHVPSLIPAAAGLHIDESPISAIILGPVADSGCRESNGNTNTKLFSWSLLVHSFKYCETTITNHMTEDKSYRVLESSIIQVFFSSLFSFN